MHAFFMKKIPDRSRGKEWVDGRVTILKNYLQLQRLLSLSQSLSQSLHRSHSLSQSLHRSQSLSQSLHLSQSLSLPRSLSLNSQSGEPKMGPKPQQEWGSATGENRSIGKRIFSNPSQGSQFVAREEQRSGIHLPREFTTIFTVRNSFTMVNSPMVTLTAMGAPRAASPLFRPELQESQPQPQLQLQGLQEGWRSSASRATALPSAMMKGPPLEVPLRNWSVTVVTSASVEPNRVTRR